MEYTFVIISTSNGQKYARAIGRRLFAMGHHYRIANTANMLNVINKCPENTTIVHSRIAYPFISSSQWLAELVGIKIPVINHVPTLMLTSNKLACNKALALNGVRAVPSYEIKQLVEMDDYFKSFKEIIEIYPNGFIAKPIVSSGGKDIFLFKKDDIGSFQKFLMNFNKNKFFLQPYLNLIEMRRVITLNKVSMDIGFMDERHPEDPRWKLSVCMNPDIQRCVLGNDEKVLANKVQNIVGGQINFIDLMRDVNGDLFVSEVNTSCNLSRHDRLVDGKITSAIANTLRDLAGRNL